MKMKWIAHIITAALLIPAVTHAAATNESVYAKARDRSNMIITCNVVDEGPLGDGKAVQKAYEVHPTHFLWSDLHMPPQPDPFWIYYDSSEFPDDLKSGNESAYHKGDQFIAFLHYAFTTRQFRIVRTDTIENAPQITEEIRRSTEPAGGAYVSPAAGDPSAHP